MVIEKDIQFRARTAPQTATNTQVHPGVFETFVNGKIRKQILEQNSTGRTEVPIYEVPVGKTLYITSAILSHYSTRESFGFMYLRPHNSQLFSHIMGDWLGAEGHSYLTLSFPMPIMAPARSKITTVSSFGSVYSIIHGFIE